MNDGNVYNVPRDTHSLVTINATPGARRQHEQNTRAFGKHVFTSWWGAHGVKYCGGPLLVIMRQLTPDLVPVTGVIISKTHIHLHSVGRGIARIYRH